jgi:predicted ABC-type ATPase
MDAIDTFRYQLSASENVAIFSRIEKEMLLSHIKSQRQPFLIILGGQPGCGKSTHCDSIRANLSKDNAALFIDIDQLRQYHPEYRLLNKKNDKYSALYTGHDAGKWSEMLLYKAAEKKCNMVYESSLKNTTALLSLTKELKEKAEYNVSLQVLVVKPEISQVATYLRYEKKKEVSGYGRYVIPKYHDDSFNNISQALQAIKEQGLVGKIELYTRERLLFQGDYRKEDVAAIVNAEYKRPLTPEETKYIKDSWDEVRQLMFKRGCQRNEINEIDNLSRPYQVPAAVGQTTEINKSKNIIKI